MTHAIKTAVARAQKMRILRNVCIKKRDLRLKVPVGASVWGGFFRVLALKKEDFSAAMALPEW